MLIKIHPKLPMRDKVVTMEFYIGKLGFKDIGMIDFEGYLMVEKDDVQIHFFRHNTLNPKENYGQVYIRTNHIDELYKSLLANNVTIHPQGELQTKTWGQREFSLLDPDNNLLTFGQPI